MVMLNIWKNKLVIVVAYDSEIRVLHTLIMRVVSLPARESDDRMVVAVVSLKNGIGRNDRFSRKIG